MIRLAQMAAARRGGVSLEDICEEFGVSHRTAQRMTDALEETFGNVEAEDGEDRKRRWRLIDPGLSQLQLRHETGVEALEIAARTAESEGRLRHATASERPARRYACACSRPRADRGRCRSRSDGDGPGHPAGPEGQPAPKILDAIIEALRGPFRLRVRYNHDALPRILEPHGVLLGHRDLSCCARHPSKADEVRNFRIDLIHEAETLERKLRPAGRVHASPITPRRPLASGRIRRNTARWSGALRRRPPTAPPGFRFHPQQVLEPQDDGSLIVRFHAAGWLEMAWHLYQWGDKVEVIAPQALRDLVEGYRRSDFAAMP